MQICQARARVSFQAWRYMDAVRDALIRDFDDDIRLMKQRVMTPEQIVEKWALFIGLDKKKE
jgi:hypothetical protein